MSRFADFPGKKEVKEKVSSDSLERLLFQGQR